MNFIVDYFDTLNKLYGYTLTASDNNNTDELLMIAVLSDIPDINTSTQEEFNEFKNVIPDIEQKIKKKLLLQTTSNNSVVITKKTRSLKSPDDNSPKKRKPRSLKSPDDNSPKKRKPRTLKLPDDNSPNITSILKEMTKGSLISDDV
jgi:hypothetical protein